jgi:hypothetical protein
MESNSVGSAPIGVYLDPSVASWVDPVTNYAELQGLSLLHDFGLIAKFEYPEALVAPFLHELTHHWCFDSPVGSAMAMLKLRARRRVLEAKDLSRAVLLEAAEDLLRYESALILLRPLAEGLALFAEFDSFSGSSDVQSLPMQWTGIVFVRKEPPAPPKDLAPDLPGALQDISRIFMKPAEQDELNRLLLRARYSEKGESRKANLLSQPFDSNAGGYLPGYMTVRSLWRHAASSYHGFTDTDLFLTYLRQFFYGDLGLVAVLTDPGTREFDTVAAVLNRVLERFSEFFRTDFSTEVPQFEKFVSGFALQRSNVPAPGISLSTKLTSIGRKRLDEMTAELLREPQKGEPTYSIDDAWAMQQREAICIARLDVNVRVSQHGNVVATQLDKPLLVTSMPALHGVPPIEAVGSVSVLLFPSRGHQVVAVEAGDTIVGAFSNRGEASEIIEMVRNFRLSAKAYARREAATELLLKKLKELPGPLRDRVDLLLKVEADRHYSRLPFFGHGDAAAAACAALLHKTGFWDILGGDRNLLDRFALLSVVTSFLLSKSQVASLFEQLELGINLDELIEKVTHCQRVAGFDILSDLGETIVTWF